MKLRYELVPGEFISSVARALTHGAEKHGADWVQPGEWSKQYGALQRHLQAWFQGEAVDPDSGLPHLALASARLAFLVQYENRGQGTNDLNGQMAYGDPAARLGPVPEPAEAIIRNVANGPDTYASRYPTPVNDPADDLSHGKRVAEAWARHNDLTLEQLIDMDRQAKAPRLPLDTPDNQRMAYTRFMLAKRNVKAGNVNALQGAAIVG